MVLLLKSFQSLSLSMLLQSYASPSSPQRIHPLCRFRLVSPQIWSAWKHLAGIAPAMLTYTPLPPAASISRLGTHNALNRRLRRCNTADRLFHQVRIPARVNEAIRGRIATR